MSAAAGAAGAVKVARKAAATAAARVLFMPPTVAGPALHGGERDH